MGCPTGWPRARARARARAIARIDSSMRRINNCLRTARVNNGRLRAAHAHCRLTDASDDSACALRTLRLLTHIESGSATPVRHWIELLADRL